MRGTVAVVGLGLIGGSLAAALKTGGWHVRGSDSQPGVAQRAMELGLIDQVDDGAQVDLAFIATPVSYIGDEAIKALARSKAVSDVGSVKQPVVSAVDNQRFVGGHPMAGSEQSGVEAARPDLFRGATWVLTPTEATDGDAYVAVRTAVSALGAEVVTLGPAIHDEMVATVSHVPHLTASALMKVALDHAGNNEAVLRLAAGGFRDMTRIAAGHPGLWTDIALRNAGPVADGLQAVIVALSEFRDSIQSGDTTSLRTMLTEAADARQGLPAKQGRPAELATLAIEIPDRPAALGKVLGLFGDLSVNVEDLEIDHALDGTRGTLLVSIAAQQLDTALCGLRQAEVNAVEREI